MYAIQFNSKINNGVIDIPKEYRDQIKQLEKAKIIVLSDKVPSKTKKGKFNAISINTKGFQFSREEANAR